MFNFQALLDDPQFQMGLGLLGQANPKHAPMLGAYNMLQQRKAGQLEAAMKQAELAQKMEQTRLYGAQVRAQERAVELDAQQRETIQKLLPQIQQMIPGMGGQPQAPQPPAMPPAAPPAPPQVGKYGTPNIILDNLEQIESNGNPFAVGPPVGGSRALGAYQFMPSTIQMLEKKGYGKFSPFDRNASRDAADFYIQDLLKEHGGDYPKALAAYGGFKSKDPTAYVSKVLKGAPEAQATQARNFNQGAPQLQALQPYQQLGVLGGLLGATMDKPSNFGTHLGNISSAIKPDHEGGRLAVDQQRAVIDQQRLQNEQARTGIQQQQADIEADREARIQREKATERNAQVSKDQNVFKNVDAAAGRLEKSVDELIKHPGLKSITGLSALTNPLAVPGSPAYGALGLLKSVQAKLTNDTLQAIRDGAANGASGYGQFTEKELPIIENYVANLDPASPDFLKNLEAVREHLKGMRNRAADLYENSTGKSAFDGLPPGARRVGTSKGKAVFKLPDGSMVMEK